MRHDEKDITFQSTFGNASWSIAASLDWVRPCYQQDTWRQVPVCLLAYVSALKSQEDLPYRASGRLPNVNVAICSIYKLPCCPRTGAPCVLYISKQLFMSIRRTIADPWMTFHSHSYEFYEFMMGCVWGLNVDLMQQHVWKLFSLWLESEFSACKSLKWPHGHTGQGRKHLGHTEKVGLWANEHILVSAGLQTPLPERGERARIQDHLSSSRLCFFFFLCRFLTCLPHIFCSSCLIHPISACLLPVLICPCVTLTLLLSNVSVSVSNLHRFQLWASITNSSSPSFPLLMVLRFCCEMCGWGKKIFSVQKDDNLSFFRSWFSACWDGFALSSVSECL